VAAATFDKSRELNLYARIGETGVPITLTFVNEDLTPHPIASYDFKLRVKRRIFSSDYIFELSVGAGLTVTAANKLEIGLTYAQSLQKEDTYFFTLYSENEDHTWLNGAFPMFKGVFDGVANEENQVVVSNVGNDVTVTITNPTSTGENWSINDWEGVIALPTTVPRGYVIKFLYDCVVPYLGGNVTYTAGSLAVSLVANSGSPGNWVVLGTSGTDVTPTDSFTLREDGFYVLREDSFKFIKEN